MIAICEVSSGKSWCRDDANQYSVIGVFLLLAVRTAHQNWKSISCNCRKSAFITLAFLLLSDSSRRILPNTLNILMIHCLPRSYKYHEQVREFIIASNSVKAWRTVRYIIAIVIARKIPLDFTFLHFQMANRQTNNLKDKYGLNSVAQGI